MGIRVVHPFVILVSFLSLAVVVTITVAEASSSSEDESIYDVLRKYGLPEGLFPKGVKSYSLGADGGLQVDLESPCYTMFENTVHYEKRIKGMIKYSEIRELSGMQAQELFLWFNVTRIRVDVPPSAFIYFDVGVVSKQFSISLFEAPPDCQIGDSFGTGSGSSVARL